MNPNTTIRSWLLSAGKQFGIRYASDYRFSDDDTRQHEMYCEYRILSILPSEDGVRDLSSRTEDEYDVHWRVVQEHIATVEVTLYNSQDGMYELAAMALAVRGIPSIDAVLGGQCEFVQVTGMSNQSIVHDGTTEYIHSMTCEFRLNVEYLLDETNGVVEEIEATYNIT